MTEFILFLIIMATAITVNYFVFQPSIIPFLVVSFSYGDTNEQQMKLVNDCLSHLEESLKDGTYLVGVRLSDLFDILI